MIDQILAAPIIPKGHKSNRWGALRFAAVNVGKSGPWLEFGVYQGRSARWLLRHLPVDGQLHLFDSFDGLPRAWEDRLPQGHFALDRKGRPRFNDRRVRMHVGLFADTLPEYRKASRKAPALVHIDCDLYESTRDVLAGIGSLIGPGCILAFDELYNYPGYESHEYRALIEWLDQTGLQVRVLGRTAKRQVVLRVEDS